MSVYYSVERERGEVNSLELALHDEFHECSPQGGGQLCATASLACGQVQVPDGWVGTNDWLPVHGVVFIHTAIATHQL